MTHGSRWLKAAKALGLSPWRGGVLTHTTIAGGLPRIPAGHPYRLENAGCYEDLVAERMTGCDCAKRLHCGHDDTKCVAFRKPRSEPDTTDDATQGVLLAHIREVFGSHASPLYLPDSDSWEIANANAPTGRRRRTSVEAMVSALELAVKERE